MKVWGHDELANDLAAHLRGNSDRMVWTDMQMGPSGSPRPDVYTINKSYSRPMYTAYEVKVSVSDFLSDVNSAKWQKYLNFSGGVTFCVPEGLIKKTDIPNGCGLMYRYDTIWKTVKAAKLGRCSIPETAWLKLLIDGVKRQRAPQNPQRQASSYFIADQLRKKIGEDVAKYIKDKESCESYLKSVKDQTKEIREEIQKLSIEKSEITQTVKKNAIDNLSRDFDYLKHDYNALLEAMGLNIGTDRYEVIREIRKLNSVVSECQRLKTALNTLTMIQSNINHGISELEKFKLNIQ